MARWRSPARPVPALIGYVVPGRDSPPAGRLREFLGERLPRHMVPVAFVFLARFPLSRNGKVDRAALPAHVRGSDAKRGAAGRAPNDDVEARIAAAFAELLGCADVGTSANFFDLGGHSLLAMRLLYRFEAEFGVSVSAREFFAEPTVAGLARRIRDVLGAPAAPSSRSRLTPPVASALRKGMP